ncbi:hypothetical protein H5410_038151 [Solanum commersonii]|uniref:Glabrous enhancer-binding protein-like DBD domain-containing protein n=1 Tax=Solanum commersonii TaxID=4109 RepID=A0A9J5YAH1_SOLCO|nr:hypothetical protein H5410_038151 [Solanum commersonii]
MAPKTKSRLVDQPPSASSSEEQELVEESQEEEEEQQSGEEEGEENEEPKTAHPVVKRSLTQKLQFSSESGSENGSGSESEAESGHSLPSPSASDFTVKPSVPTKAAAPSKSVAKRPQEAQKEKGRKKPKIVEEEEKKSAATPRFLWSDDDQLALLKGIAEYKAVEGMEPKVDMSAFHEFIRGKLQVEVSKSQLSEKLKRLKKKFLTNVKGGEEPVFTKGQDFLVFQHSKRIWGAPGTSNGVKEIVSNSTNGKAKNTVEVKNSSEPKKNAKDFQSEYPHLAASFESMAGMSTMYPNGKSFLKENMSLIATDKAKVLEEKWKKLEDDEAALMVKRLDFIAEHYGLVVDAMRVIAWNRSTFLIWFSVCHTLFLLLQKHKEEEKQVAVKEVAKEDIVQGDEQDFRSKYPRLAASFESMAGMSTMYPNGTSYWKEKMSLIATDKAKELEEKWKKLEDDEAALMVRRLDFIAEHYKLVVDAMRGN